MSEQELVTITIDGVQTKVPRTMRIIARATFLCSFSSLSQTQLVRPVCGSRPVIIGAITRDNVRGTWVESHYSWLLRTFMWGILWMVATTIVFVVTVIGIFLLWLPWGILTIWYLYRVIRGWMRLNDGKPAPA